MLRSAAISPLSSAFKASMNLNYSLTPHFIRHNPIFAGIMRQTSVYGKRPIHVQNALFGTTSARLLDGRVTGADFKNEQAAHRKQKLEPNPIGVSTTSSVRKVFEPAPASKVQNVSGEPDMMRGIYSDLRIMKETFALNEVPKEVFWIGMGGVTPYVVTSFSTLYLAWDINYATVHGAGYLVSNETADHLLHILEPTQVGLGAIILSFLGAVHWGLEMAEFGGKHPYRRYTIGILAPALAWPTILLPLDYALITQFAGFIGMYYADSNATTLGWAPRWYTTYRFILTFIVGACIFITLIGRGQIGDAVSLTEGARKHLQDIRSSQRENMHKEEKERMRYITAEQKKTKHDKEQRNKEGT